MVPSRQARPSDDRKVRGDIAQQQNNPRRFSYRIVRRAARGATRGERGVKAHIGGTYWHGKEFVNTVGVTGDDRGLRACRHRGGAVSAVASPARPASAATPRATSAIRTGVPRAAYFETSSLSSASSLSLSSSSSSASLCFSGILYPR